MNFGGKIWIWTLGWPITFPFRFNNNRRQNRQNNRFNNNRPVNNRPVNNNRQSNNRRPQTSTNQNPLISNGRFRATPANARDKLGNEVYPGCNGTVCLPEANLCARRKNKRKLSLFFFFFFFLKKKESYSKARFFSEMKKKNNLLQNWFILKHMYIFMYVCEIFLHWIDRLLHHCAFHRKYISSASKRLDMEIDIYIDLKL